MDTTQLRAWWRMVKGVPAGPTYASRLDAFYRPQANAYDSMRQRALQSRKRLLELLAPAPGSRVVDMGAGTGTMLDLWGARLPNLAALELVDICPAMLKTARHRSRLHANVRVVESDATDYRAPWLADCVYFSYSLTMIPDWVRALDNALALLKPGGKLGIVDYYVADPAQNCTRERHDALTRWFWTHWLHHDQILLSPRHIPALCMLTEKIHLQEDTEPLPYFPPLRAPSFVFVGVAPARPRRALITDLWKNSATKP